jgi:prepilin-type N-terminal cleavage/methylation domain-containing protein
MKRKGFTLIELLVVIAIIGLLSTLSVVSLNSARGKARDAARKSDINAIATAMELYNVEIGSYPATGADCLNAGVPIDNIIALNPAIGATMCGGNRIISGTDVILQSIPEPPVEDDYEAYVVGSNYCIHALLEDGTYFKCINGSCFLDVDNGDCDDEEG